eukprot:SAG22_NODE_641_length_8235_cov_9.502704_8_plen_178_part_00
MPLLLSNWLTDGPEKVWALRIMGLGGRVGYTIAGALTPWLAARAGWQAIPLTLGSAAAAFGVVWQIFAAESPAAAAVTAAVDTTVAPGAKGSDDGDHATAKTEPKVKEKSMEWGIFTVPAVLGTTAAHIASNNLGYLFLQWSPTYYNEILKISNVSRAACTGVCSSCCVWIPGLAGT